MKKTILFLSLVISISTYATVELKTNTHVSVTITNKSADKYEHVKDVSGITINIKTGKLNSYNFKLSLYKGVNTCNSYYLAIPTYSGSPSCDYCPVYKNTSSTYKGVDVSDYNYYSQQGDYRYYFFY